MKRLKFAALIVLWLILLIGYKLIIDYRGREPAPLIRELFFYGVPATLQLFYDFRRVKFSGRNIFFLASLKFPDGYRPERPRRSVFLPAIRPCLKRREHAAKPRPPQSSPEVRPQSKHMDRRRLLLL